MLSKKYDIILATFGVTLV